MQPPAPSAPSSSKSSIPWGWVALGVAGLGAALLLMGGGASVLAENSESRRRKKVSQGDASGWSELDEILRGEGWRERGAGEWGYYLKPPEEESPQTSRGPLLRNNPSYFKLAADANRDAERAIARAKMARGAERARELDEAERLVRQAVEYGRLAGEKWLSYETSSGREEIERLRGRP